MFNIINKIITIACVISCLFFLWFLVANFMPSLNLQWTIAWIPTKTRWAMVLPYVIWVYFCWRK